MDSPLEGWHLHERLPWCRALSLQCQWIIHPGLSWTTWIMVRITMIAPVLSLWSVLVVECNNQMSKYGIEKSINHGGRLGRENSHHLPSHLTLTEAIQWVSFFFSVAQLVPWSNRNCEALSLIGAKIIYHFEFPNRWSSHRLMGMACCKIATWFAWW